MIKQNLKILTQRIAVKARVIVTGPSQNYIVAHYCLGRVRHMVNILSPVQLVDVPISPIIWHGFQVRTGTIPDLRPPRGPKTA